MQATKSQQAGERTQNETTIIDDTQFRFPVATSDLENWEVENGELTGANYEQFCGEVKCSLPDVRVGTVEMIDVCEALIEGGAKVKLI